MTFRPLSRRLAAVLSLAFALGACGNATETSPGQMALKTAAGLLRKPAPAAATPPLTRGALEAFNAPILQVDVASTGMQLFVVPVAQNGDVQTWSTSNDITIALRGGVLAATRGIGPDLIESRTPTLASLRAAGGTVSRTAGFLDGGDRLVTFRSACEPRLVGTEPLVVLDVQHSARHVRESCDAGAFRFENDYWFDSAGKLLKSSEYMAPGVGHVVITRLIDR